MSEREITYDTAAIRREARKIKQCYEHIDSAAIPRVNGARSRLDGSFKGRTADALDDSLVKTRDQIKTLRDDLRSLYSALTRYADALEEADRRMAKLFEK